jgi:hypothetical protein
MYSILIHTGKGKRGREEPERRGKGQRGNREENRSQSWVENTNMSELYAILWLCPASQVKKT